MHSCLHRLSKSSPYTEIFLFNTAEKEVIEAKERESPKRAASLLLDQIIASDELGKWTTFIAALKTVGRYFITGIGRFQIIRHYFQIREIRLNMTVYCVPRQLFCCGYLYYYYYY